MVYKPYNEFPNSPPVQNPHSPATGTVKQQPVNIPGVLDQTRQLFKPYVSEQPKDSK